MQEQQRYYQQGYYLLIVPYGIKIYKESQQDYGLPDLLIVPYGIKIS